MKRIIDGKLPQAQYLSSSHVLAEIQSLGETYGTQLPTDCFGRCLRDIRPLRDDAVEEDLHSLPVRCREPESHLETAPHGPVEQFSMVGGGNDDNVARQLVKLHEQEGDDALDLTRLVGVTAFLADGVELIKEEHAWPCPHVIEQLAQPRIGFAKIASDQGIVSDDEEGQAETLGHGLGKGCLAVPRRA